MLLTGSMDFDLLGAISSEFLDSSRVTEFELTEVDFQSPSLPVQCGIRNC